MKIIIPLKHILALLLLLNTLVFVAQNSSAKGDKYFDQNLFESAIKYYQAEIHSKNKKVSEYAMQRLADCYRITGEFELAEDTYRKILKKKKKDPKNYLNYGLSLKSSAKYAEAIVQFREYTALKPEDPMGRVYLLSCDSAQAWLDETIGKEVKNLSYINTDQSDFSPVMYPGNTLSFTSARPGSKAALISFDGGMDMHRLDLYNIALDKIESKENKKTDIVNLKDINSELHEGPASFSKDGHEIYFTKTIKGAKNKSTNTILSTLQIYYSKKDSAGNWLKPVSAFSYNSLSYSIGHPSLSKDGETLYFMSDMPGGFGKTDIYYSRRQQNGSWGKPINAGNSVNTFGNELFPYISDSGDLYFSSNAHPGMGQLDIFRASLEDQKWSNIRNLKPPVNSIGNDFGITFYQGLACGFFSSDRFNGKGAEDIYSFSEELPLELFIIGDTLSFADLSLFDDVKYKLRNETDSAAVELLPGQNKLMARIEKGKSYRLYANRYGLKYNQVSIYCTKNVIDTSLSVKVSSTAKNILIKGRTYLGLKSIWKLKGGKEAEKFSPAGNAAYSELEISLDKNGYFSYTAFISAGKEHVISSDDITRDYPGNKNQ